MARLFRAVEMVALACVIVAALLFVFAQSWTLRYRHKFVWSR